MGTLVAALVLGAALAWPAVWSAKRRIRIAPEGLPSPIQWNPILTPPKQAGSSGWSVLYTRRHGRRFNEGSLRPAPGKWILWRYQRRAIRIRPTFAAVGFLITAGRVASVSVDGGAPIPTAPAAGLQLGYRVVAYEIPFATAAEAHEFLFGRLLITARAYNAKGQPLPPYAGTEPLGQQLETEEWEGSDMTHGACRIASSHLPGLTSRGGSVVKVLRPVIDLTGRPFLSCANTKYEYGTQSLEAAIVLDATHPGVPPAPIPATKPVPGHRGVIESRITGEDIVARRVPGAWLLVEGGASLRERVIVLAHLRAATHI